MPSKRVEHVAPPTPPEDIEPPQPPSTTDDKPEDAYPYSTPLPDPEDVSYDEGEVVWLKNTFIFDNDNAFVLTSMERTALLL